MPRLAADAFWTVLRYFSVSAGVYLFILFAMYALVDRAGLGKVTSYVLVYLAAYVAEYTLTLRFVFRKPHAWHKVLRFLANTALFLVAGSFLFEGLLRLGMNYLVATLAVAAALLPFRFLSNKHFVYA